MYLILYFPLAAILNANAAIITLAMWMVGQSAIYQYESGRIMWALTIILQKSSPLQVAAAAVGALGMWVIFRRKIKAWVDVGCHARTLWASISNR